MDQRLQSDFAYQQPGTRPAHHRRGQGDRAGEWVVIDLWRSAEDADAAAGPWDDDPTAQELMALVGADTVEIRRYVDLD